MPSDTKPTTQDKITYSVISAIIFFIVANPITYRLVEKILGGIVTVAYDGCPTIIGLSLHTLVFFAVILGVMHIEVPKY